MNQNNDLISRQVAIDIERNATVDTNPSHFEAHQKFTQFMDDAEVSSFGRWQWSNGFNTALTAVGIDLKKLPSAQPEQRWIPCSERMPEYNESVLTWDGFVFCIEKRIPYIRDDDGEPIEGDWWVGDEYDEYVSECYPNLRDGAAIAWMPLPKPWEGEEAE